jgi:hypothetical protein
MKSQVAKVRVFLILAGVVIFSVGMADLRAVLII